MESELVICQELATLIGNKNDYSHYTNTISANHGYIVEPELETLTKAPQIDCVPLRLNPGFGSGSALQDRTTFSDQWGILVVVNAGGIKPSDKTEISRLRKLVLEIQVEIAKRHDEDGVFSSAEWIGAMSNDPIFDREKLKNDNHFHSVMEFLFVDISRSFG